MSTSRAKIRLLDDLSEIKDFTDLVLLATQGLPDVADRQRLGRGLNHMLYLVERLQERVEDAQ